jgi:CheY-like chemotaxis protein
MAEILVAEQDIDVGNSIVESLEAEGHRTVRARDGLEALGRNCSGEYDLAILDVNLPGIDGAGLVEAIKRRTPRTMAIMVCGRTDLEKAGEAMREGAYDFIEKPLIEDNLISTAGSALREAREMKRSGYVYKDHFRNDRSLMAARTILTFSDSLLSGLAFFAALTVCKYILEVSPLNLSVSLTEILRLSLGMAFCYAFSSVFLRSYRFEGAVLGRIPAIQIWKNSSVAYMIFLGILFLSGNVQLLSGRVGVLLGYALGTGILIVSRKIVIPLFHAGSRREGKKKIVIVGSTGQEPVDSPLTFGRLDSLNPALKRAGQPLIDRDQGGEEAHGRRRVDRDAVSADTDEVHINAEALSALEVLSLLDRHRGRAVEVKLQQTSRERPTQDAGHSRSLADN